MYIAKVVNSAPVPIPKGIENVAKALEDAKGKKRPCVIFFWDGSQRNMLFEENIMKKPALGQETWSKVSFVKLQYRKNSPEAKQFRVRSAPTIVIVDNSKEKPKIIKTVRAGTPQGLRKAVEDAIKKLSK